MEAPSPAKVANKGHVGSNTPEIGSDLKLSTVSISSPPSAAPSIPPSAPSTPSGSKKGELHDSSEIGDDTDTSALLERFKATPVSEWSKIFNTMIFNKSKFDAMILVRDTFIALSESNPSPSDFNQAGLTPIKASPIKALLAENGIKTLAEKKIQKVLTSAFPIKTAADWSQIVPRMLTSNSTQKSISAANSDEIVMRLRFDTLTGIADPSLPPDWSISPPTQLQRKIVIIKRIHGLLHEPDNEKKVKQFLSQNQACLDLPPLFHARDPKCFPLFDEAVLRPFSTHPEHPAITLLKNESKTPAKDHRASLYMFLALDPTADPLFRVQAYVGSADLTKGSNTIDPTKDRWTGSGLAHCRSAANLLKGLNDALVFPSKPPPCMLVDALLALITLQNALVDSDSEKIPMALFTVKTCATTTEVDTAETEWVRNAMLVKSVNGLNMSDPGGIKEETLTHSETCDSKESVSPIDSESESIDALKLETENLSLNASSSPQ